MNHTLFTILCLISGATLFANPQSTQEAPKTHSWSKIDHLKYFARALTPSMVSAVGALATLYAASKVEGSYSKLGVGAAGNAGGLLLAAYAKNTIAEQEKTDEKNHGKKLPYSVNSLPLRYLPAGISVFGCFAVAVQHIHEQERQFEKQTLELNTTNQKISNEINKTLETANRLEHAESAYKTYLSSLESAYKTTLSSLESAYKESANLNKAHKKSFELIRKIIDQVTSTDVAGKGAAAQASLITIFTIAAQHTPKQTATATSATAQ